MKIFLRLFLLVFLVQGALEATAQCNGAPSVSNATHANITATTARLGGNVTNEGAGNCTVYETGVEWSTTFGGPYTTVIGTETGSGPFTVDVTGLPAGTRIFYRAYGTNGHTTDPTDYTAENTFYTLALEPAAHAATLSATAVNNHEILLQFPAAGDIANADGYIILMETGSAANTNNLNDGTTPNGASDFKHLLSSTSATSYTVTGLSPNTNYHFAIVPYNRESDDATYNYRTTAGYPTASATTEADVDVNAITGNLAATGTPLNSSSTDRALAGFALDASGPMAFESVVIHLTSTTTGKLTNWRLCASNDATFNGVATDPPLAGVTITPAATTITITLSEALLATPTRNFFLIADVEPGVNASTPSVQLSYNETDFTFNPNNLSGTGSQSRTYTFADVTPPILASTSPADDATAVDFNLDKLTLTFNENVDNITTAATDATGRVIIFDAATDAAVLTVARGSVSANGTTLVEVTIPPGTFQPNSDYYVQVGNAVIEDVPADNDWPGVSDKTTWNFATSGVAVNGAVSSICGGSFQSIGDIVISEEASGDFITSGTINLEFANPNFGFDISSATVSVGPPGNTDITAIQLNPKTLTRLTLDYSLDGTNDKVDVITISGLKIYASTHGSTTIVNQNSLAGAWASDPFITFATINVGASSPAAPVLETSPTQDLSFCQNEDINAAKIAVEDDGGTFTWYNNATLSSAIATGSEVDVQADLGINSAVVGTVKRYVVRVQGCQSIPLELTFQVTPIPVADAGAATVDICSGSPVTLGGTPTLIGPSVSGPYQYLWSTNPPAGFTDLGPNPVVSPTYPRDTTFNYTVKIVDSNNCASDILDPNATIAVQVDSTDEAIVYNSPLNTNFTLNSDPIELDATPSSNSSYSGSGVYLSAGKYYFDPDLAGTAGSPHAITYFTELSNGCPKTEVRNFGVSNSSGSIINLAGSYCQNEVEDFSDVLALGTDWSNYLAQDNAYYSTLGYTYEFYDFQTYVGTDIPGTGVKYPTPTGAYPDAQHIDPATLQPYPFGGGNYAYIGMRVRRKYPTTILGIPTGGWSYDPPIFWMVQYVNFYQTPPLKVRGVASGQIVCDVDQNIELEANYESGTFEISRDQTNWVSGPTVGIVDNPVNSGKALFNPHNAYVSTGFAAPLNIPASGITNFYIRYTYVVPGTSGSNSSACEATLIIPFKISNNPTVAWVPFTKTEFCYEAANVNVKTDALEAGEFDVISGFGVFDNGNSTAVFDPDEGLKAKAFATNNPPYTDYNSPETIIISAKRTDGNGCSTTINQTVSVHPLFPASFTESDLSLCYEDGTQNIVGAQPNGSFVLSHPKLTVNFPQTTLNNFNLRTYFDQAVAAGADGSVMQTFDLTFKTFDPALGCQNSLTKSFSVNPPILMDIGGLTSGQIVCGNGAPFELTGNQPSAGSFEISTSPNSGFVNNALGLANTTSGKATYTPSGAGFAAGTPQQSLYIRYSFLGPGCVGSAQTTETLIVNPQPAVAFTSIPAAGTAYCYEQSASPTTIDLTATPATNVTFLGFGITDNGNGTSVFNPTSAYQQSSLADNLNPATDQTVRNIVLTARRTDAQSCVNTATVSYVVNPLPTATFAPAQQQFCYEDDAVTLSGGQTNVSYQFIYKNTTSPANYSPPVLVQSTAPFDPAAFFDDAVSKGANSLATLQFDVIYTAINNTTGCTNRKDPVVLTVSPRIPVEIAGISEGEVFCSNITDKELVFNPPNGTFRINGNAEPFSSGQYIFNPPIDGPASGTDYTFTYTVITGNNCTNTQQKTIKVLPSPRALFEVQPQCDTALIAYNAEPSTNLATSVYTWNFSGQIKTGQNVEHRFPGVSTYYAKLKVEHPPFVIDANNTLVCADSLQQDQVVGPYPKDINFKYYNVCEGDPTNFEVTSTVPLNRVSWDFGDGESTGLGILSDNITGLAQTEGTYQFPVHRFSTAADELTVRLLGRTSDNFGGCPSIFETKLSILKKWAPSPAEPFYDMSALDNGKGFWVAEDKLGNGSWEFTTAAKQRIVTNEPTWVTGPAEPYKANDVSYVNSPCFDLSSFSRPVISIKHWTDTEPSDGAVLQYSTDGGNNWFRLGDVASGLDWYNRLTISSNPGEQTDLSSGWSLNTQNDWAVGKHTLDVLPPDRHQVRFRVAFASFNNRESHDGFAFNNVVIEERNRTILVENFTSLAQDNTAFKTFRTINGVFNPEEVVKLQYHHAPAQTNAQPDQLHLDNPVDADARAAFYGVTGPTRAFVDGGFGQATTATFGSPALDLYFSLRSLVTAPVMLTLDFVDDPDDRLNVKATVQATNDLGAPGQYNVFIAVAERSIEGQVYVLRKLLPDAAGIPLTSLSATDPAQEINVSYDMRHVTRLPDGSFAPFAVIVFVQNLQTKDVLQTIMREDGSVSSDLVTGIETPYDQYIRVYPNPADELINIILPAPAAMETPLKMFDTFGRQVYSGTFQSGENVKTLETKTLSAGVYLIQLSTPEGLVQKKAMVVHE